MALVPLGTPFLAEPEAIVATSVLTRQHPALGERLVEATSGIHFLTRIMGVLLTAIAVQLVADAVTRWLRAGLG